MAKRKQGLVVAKPGVGAAAGSASASAAGPPAAAVAASGSSAAASACDVGGGGGRKKKRRIKAPGVTAEAAPADDSSEGAADAPTAEVAGHSASGSAAAAGEQPPEAPWATGRPLSSAADALAWLLWPMSPGTFFAEYWEKKPLHLRRGRPRYYGDVFSKAALDQHLREGTPLGYGERINLARTDPAVGKKVDMNKGSRGELADYAQVHEAWTSGGSIQVMHMQQFHEPVWKLLAALERSFGALFGTNAYLTPGGNQGFAPHYDDVEVFMLQLEGSKRWRLWEPPLGEEFPLPREYSRDFVESELGDPLLDVVLEAGDMLYLPRGHIHAGVADPKAGGGFSHHLTVSTYQKTAWCHLLDRTLSSAIERAAGSSAEFREGLPVGFLRYMGSWHDCVSIVGDTQASKEKEESRSSGRAAFMRHFKGLLRRLEEFVDVDEACDELGVEFMSSRLPTPAAASKPSKPAAAKADASGGDEDGGPSLALEASVRWRDPSTVRAMLSTDPETSEATVMLFHSCDNDRGVHMSGASQAREAEEEVGCLRFEAATFLPALRALLALPDGASMRCGEVPLKDEEDRVALCENLVEAGLLEVVEEAAATDPKV
mmetsp:Transcript_110424/g.319141  ORF Transcript_110424/g.319141 Transcript_110424/m.319141 type:complete len:602 (-) Transcript_110424:109-1914(-)